MHRDESCGTIRLSIIYAFTFDNLYPHTMLCCVHEQKAQGVQVIGVSNKNAVYLWALPNNWKYNEAGFSIVEGKNLNSCEWATIVLLRTNLLVFYFVNWRSLLTQSTSLA